MRPILEYACELWGDEIPIALQSQMEAVQNEFARRILDIPSISHAHTDALRAELGIEPLTARWTKLRLLYWYRIINLPPQRFLRSYAMATIALVDNDPEANGGWFHTTRRILTELQMEEYWRDPPSCTTQSYKEWKACCYQAVETRHENLRQERLLIRPRLQYYSCIKEWGPTPLRYIFTNGEIGRQGALTPERYLDTRTEPIGRRLKTFCRLNVLPLMDKITEDEKWPLASAQCPFCGHAKEDLPHLLLWCPQYAHYRAKLFETIAWITPHLSENWFTDLPSKHQVCILLGGRIDVGCPDIEAKLDLGMTRFLRKTWRTRRLIVIDINQQYNRRDPLIE